MPRHRKYKTVVHKAKTNAAIFDLPQGRQTINSCPGAKETGLTLRFKIIPETHKHASSKIHRNHLVILQSFERAFQQPPNVSEYIPGQFLEGLELQDARER